MPRYDSAVQSSHHRCCAIGCNKFGESINCDVAKLESLAFKNGRQVDAFNPGMILQEIVQHGSSDIRTKQRIVFFDDGAIPNHEASTRDKIVIELLSPLGRRRVFAPCS